VIHHDPTDGYDEVLTMTAPGLNADGTPNGSEAISNTLQTLTRDYTNDAGQVVSEDDYFNLGGLAYSTGAMGALNVNYYQTNYGYDNWGRLVRTQTPNGTIYRTVYNSLDEDVSDWVGTNDTPLSLCSPMTSKKCSGPCSGPTSRCRPPSWRSGGRRNRSS
jgi:YD repeat-containing protein